MIWARPLGDWPAGPLLARAGLAAAEADGVQRSLPAAVLVTGLDGETREILGSVVDAALIGGAGDAVVLHATRAAIAGWLEHRQLPEDLARALRRLLELGRPRRALELGRGAALRLGERTLVMGVINVTPDSFSDGGTAMGVEAAVARAREHVAGGADLLDVGGESTRPGADPVGEAEELSRVMPVVEALVAALPGVPLSIDTRKPGVARRALAAGAHLVNDVGGLADPHMVEVVVEAGAAACAMHMRGTPATMQAQPAYDDVLAEVLDTLEQNLARAARLGLPRERVLVDPGLGFGKTAAHNLFLLRRAGELRLLGAGVVVGASRKSFLGALVKGKPPAERVVASVAAAAVVAASGGADVVRVHDVAATVDALAVADGVARAADGGRRFT